MSGFDTTPKPRMLLALKQWNWHTWGALAELVDNGFGQGRGNADTVHITYHKKGRILRIFDNGQGMTELGPLFQGGSEKNMVKGDIGQYGWGGFHAIIWLAKKVTVWTLRQGKVCRYTVDWRALAARETFPKIPNAWEEPNPGNTPKELLDAGHGTLIEMYLDERRYINPEREKSTLGELYGPAIRKGKQLLWTTITGRTMVPRAERLGFDVKTLSQAVTFDDTIEDKRGKQSKYLPFFGQVGILPDLPPGKSKVYLGYGHRVVKGTTHCFIPPDGRKRYPADGVIGFIDLGDEWYPYLTTHKDGISDPSLYDALMHHIFKRVEPLLGAAEQTKKSMRFQSLALCLESALNGLVNYVWSVGGTTHHSTKHEHKTPADDPNKPPKEPPKPSQPSQRKHQPGVRPGNEFSKPERGLANIQIFPVSDKEIGRAIVRVDLDGTAATVLINQEYPLINGMLSSDRLEELLAIPLTRELATAICTKPGAIEQLLAPKVAEQLLAVDEPERVLQLQRGLLDQWVRADSRHPVNPGD